MKLEKNEMDDEVKQLISKKDQINSQIKELEEDQNRLTNIQPRERKFPGFINPSINQM